MKKSELIKLIKEVIDNAPGTFTIPKIKELISKYINLNSYKITNETDNNITAYSHGYDYVIDITIQNENDPYWANQLYVALQAKVEISSVSLSDPRSRYQTTSARRVAHKNIKIREYVDSYVKLEKLLKKYSEKIK